jgi:hypothetical protein
MSHKRHHFEQPMKRTIDINDWSIKGPLLVVALLLGFFDHALHFGRASFAAGVAMVVPVIIFRDYWSKAKFWITVLLLGAGQAALVYGTRSMTEQFGFPFMLGF